MEADHMKLLHIARRACVTLALISATSTALAQEPIQDPSFQYASLPSPIGGLDLTPASTPLPPYLPHGTNGNVPNYGVTEELPEDASSTNDAASIAALEERLKELEDEYRNRSDAEKKAKSDAAKKPTFKLGGRIHMDFWDFMDSDPGIGFLENPVSTLPNFGNDPEDRFTFRRIRMEFSGDLPSNMLWRMQIDFNNPSFAEYKDVYLGWKNLPGNHTLLLGNQKRPLGLDHLNSSRYNVFAERPFIVESFNEDARRVGLAMYGHRDDESMNWAYGIYSLENTSRDGRFIGDSKQMGGYGRISGTPWYDEASGGRGYFHWALAGAVARPDGQPDNDLNANEARFRTRPLARSNSRWLNTGRIAGAQWYEILAMESVLNLGSWQFTGEYMCSFLQRDNFTPGTGNDLFFHGFYVYGAKFLTGEHMAFDRRKGTLSRAKPFENFFLVDRMCGGKGTGWGAWQLAFRYDYIDLTDEDITGGVGQSFTGGLNWYWTAYSKVQMNLIRGDIRERGPIGGFDGGDYWILGTRFMCDF
ncbi:MAG TPA: ATPase [Planctomycetaceae bacterium]|nr:ATPase [Planctomycetaceae bacterium]